MNYMTVLFAGRTLRTRLEAAASCVGVAKHPLGGLGLAPAIQPRACHSKRKEAGGGAQGCTRQLSCTNSSTSNEGHAANKRQRTGDAMDEEEDSQEAGQGGGGEDNSQEGDSKEKSGSEGDGSVGEGGGEGGEGSEDGGSGEEDGEGGSGEAPPDEEESQEDDDDGDGDDEDPASGCTASGSKKNDADGSDGASRECSRCRQLHRQLEAERARCQAQQLFIDAARDGGLQLMQVFMQMMQGWNAYMHLLLGPPAPVE